VSAEAATLFTLLGVFGFDNNSDAFEATDLDVFSFFAIFFSFMRIGLTSRLLLCRRMEA